MKDSQSSEGRPELIPPVSVYSSGSNFARTGPMTVHATGFRGEDLGVGSLIGVVHRQRNIAKVISFQDPDNPGGITELLSTECDYSSLTEEKLERIATEEPSNPPITPTQYLSSLLDMNNEIFNKYQE